MIKSKEQAKALNSDLISLSSLLSRTPFSASGLELFEHKFCLYPYLKSSEIFVSTGFRSEQKRSQVQKSVHDVENCKKSLKADFILVVKVGKYQKGQGPRHESS